MSKIMRKIFIFIFFFVLGLVLVGCKKDTTKPDDGGKTDTPTLASLDANKQGTYYGDDVVVEITASKVKITDPSGKTLEYDIYQEGDKYYILEEGRKIYCTFGDGTVTNEKGTFSKNGSSTGPKAANIPTNLQGEYFLGPMKIIVSASKVKIIEATGATMEFNLYEENGQIYVIEDGEKIICTFGEDSVTNKYGTFTRNGSALSNVTAAEAANKYKEFLGLTGDFRVPSGTSIQDTKFKEEDTDIYAITVIDPNEKYEDYYRFFNDFMLTNGFETSTAISSIAYFKMGDMIYGASLAYDTTTNGLAIVASKMENETPPAKDMTLEEFIADFKNETGITLSLPKFMEGPFTDRTIATDSGLAYYTISTKVNYTSSLDGQGIFNDIAAELERVLSPYGFAKGEPETTKYADLIEYAVTLTKTGVFDSIRLEVNAKDSDCTVVISALLNKVTEDPNKTWPSDKIKQFYDNQEIIPALDATFTNIEFVTISENEIMVNVTGLDANALKDWKLTLTRDGFSEVEENSYKMSTDTKVARVYVGENNGVTTFEFKYMVETSTPWPKDFITEKLGSAAADVIPAVAEMGYTTFNKSYSYGTLTINVECETTENAIEAYRQALTKAGFVVSSNTYDYTLDNFDVIEILLLQRDSTHPNSFSLYITYDEYEGMELDLPENFKIQINQNGFSLTKIGESYVYEYQYQGSYKSVEVYLYDASLKKWLNSTGQVYTVSIPGVDGAQWQNYGTTDNPVYFQYVERPQLDEFLASTKGLAYEYYQKMLDATNVVKDETKNANIAGVSCEYVAFSESTSVAGMSYSTTTELWLDPVTKMIYKCDYTLNMNGTVQKNTVYEIIAIDKTPTTLKAAGISNCMLPTFDKSKATDDDHLFGETQVVAATCGTAGETYQVCLCCGEKKIIATEAATGKHTPVTYNGEIAVFTDYNGHHMHKCEVCQQDYYIEDCTFDEWVVDRAATCKNTGTRHHDCKICGGRMSETIPVDRDGHLFVGTYTDNVTIVLPTKTTEGSITWTCLEECGASKSIKLPALSETSYTMGVYNDFLTDQNYKMYGLNLTKMTADINDLLKPASALDEFYISYTLFGGYNEFVYNYDENNPLYGFLGDAIADAQATISADFVGDYFNENNHKITLATNTIALASASGSIATYNLFTNSTGIYFEDASNTKIYITLNDDGSVTLTDLGTFEKRIAASISEELQGNYFDEEKTTKVVVSASKVQVINANGKVYEYDLYVKDEEIYIITEDDVKVTCEFGDGYVTNTFGTFYKEHVNNDPLAELDEEYQGVLYNEDNVMIELGENRIKLFFVEAGVEYSLHQDSDGIYFEDDDLEHVYLYLCDDYSVIVGELGTFAKRVVAHMSEDFQGTYTGDGATIVVYESRVTVTTESGSESYTLYVRDEVIYVVVDDEIIVCEFDENSVTNAFGTFTKGEEQQYNDELASINRKYHGEFFNDDNYMIAIGENKMTLVIGKDEYYYPLYQDSDGIYFRAEGERISMTLNEDYTITIEGYGDFAKRVTANLDEELQGTYYGEEGITVEVHASYVEVTTPNGTFAYDLYVRDGEYYIIDDDSIVVCEFSDNSVTNDFGTFTKPDLTEFPSAAIETFLGFDGFVTFYHDDATFTTELLEQDDMEFIVVTMTKSEEDEASYAEILTDIINSIDGYTEEYGYYDVDLGYAFFISLSEDESRIEAIYYLAS